MDLRDEHLSAYAGPLSHWERAGVRERSLAHIFDETFRVNRAFNAEVFVAAPHAVAMEFDLFGERRSSHGAPLRSIRTNHFKFRNHLKVTRVLGKQSQSILKRRGGNQRVRNHQPVAESECLNQRVRRVRDIWVDWENPNRFKKAFGVAEFYFISAADN